MERNISSLLARRRREENERTRAERIVDGVTRFAGSLPFAWIHVAIFGAWILANLGWLGIRPFDESFAGLAMVASVEAIFLSTFVLIAQNRLAALAEERADLDLQVSLLAEHEITRVLTLVTALAEKHGIEDARDPELEELQRDVHPEKVLEKISKEAPTPE